ncbi:hypothetical protein QJS04_geneDACA021893 [Acorus gramineus]|uniref:Uncharacterized protein n=1 Tax=Acorus gramineus TaxID=55184 RepID=A0AAV9B9R5_ACOGR|nr:hypothetical protein QJS04_geneDACA021893 [Acorus gramineus]
MSSHNRSARVRESFKSSKPYAIRRRLRSGNFVVVHSAAAAPKEERKLPVLPVEPINLHSDPDEEEEPSDDASAFIAPIPAVAAAVEGENGNGGEECEVDPQYMAVLAHLREDGRSYVLDMPDGGDGKPVFIKYEAVVNGGCGHEEEVLPSEEENAEAENGIENVEEEDELLDPDYVDFKNHLKVEDGWMVLEWEGFDPVVYERLDVMDIESGGDDDDDDEDEDGEFDFEKELKVELERPYDHDEYEEKMKAANCALPQERLRHLRSGSRSYPTKNKGYSLLHHYKDLEAQIESADCHTGLVLLRGFFFWLTHVAHDGAYMPWKQRASKDEVVDADML